MSWESKIGYLRVWERESIRDQLASCSDAELKEVMSNIVAAVEDYTVPPLHGMDVEYLYGVAMDLVSVLSKVKNRRELFENVHSTSSGWKLLRMIILDNVSFEEIAKLVETKGI